MTELWSKDFGREKGVEVTSLGTEVHFNIL